MDNLSEDPRDLLSAIERRLHGHQEGAPFPIDAATVLTLVDLVRAAKGELDEVRAFRIKNREYIRRQVAEEMIAEIKRVIGGYPENAAVRPRYEHGGFLNDVDWATDIVRRIGHITP